MAITLNKPYAGLRIAASSGDLVFTPREGFCDGIVLNTPYIGLRASVSGGDLVFLVSDQKVNADGTLILNKPYIGLVASQSNGDLVFLVAGKKCTTTLIDICDCTICCTLLATVQVADSGDPYTWSDPVDVTLTCGGVYQYHAGWSCLNDEIEDDTTLVKVLVTYSGKDTTASPEPYDTGSESGTYTIFSEVWSSGDFYIDGVKYRLTYIAAVRTNYQTSPTVSTTEICGSEWILQKEVNSEIDPYSPHWDIVDRSPGGIPFGWFDYSDDNPYAPDECPPGYSYNGGDLEQSNPCRTQAAPYVGGYTEDGDPCPAPIGIIYESWYRLIADPDTDPYRIKCAKVTIADLCDDEPDLQAMFDDSLNPETLFSPELEYSGWFN